MDEDLPLAEEAPSEAAPPRPAHPLAALDARVLRAFIEDGRLVSIPAQAKKRLVVLRYLATTVFEPGRRYPEKEVNQRLALLHPDVASLRRYLVEAGLHAPRGKRLRAATLRGVARSVAPGSRGVSAPQRAAA